MKHYLCIILACAAAAGCESTEETLRELTENEKEAAVASARSADKAWADLVELRGREGFEEKPVGMDARLESARSKAIEALDEFASDFEGANSRDLALFRLAESLAMGSDLEEAHEAHSEILKRYPGSTHFAEALRREFILAQRLLSGEQRSILGVGIFGKNSLPAEILESILDLGPFTEWAPQALYLLANLKIEDGEHDTAVVLLDTLVRRFPDNPLRIRAEYQSGRANYLKFNGLDYDVTPLEEALERFRAFINLHEQSRSEDVVVLVGMDRGAAHKGPEPRFSGARLFRWNIENLLAEKNWRVGRWYESEGIRDAAIASFRYILQEYPESDWAARASYGLAALAGK